MKPERIEELMSLTPDAMCEEATDAELLHLLRCARERDELRARVNQLEKNGSFAVGMASETAVFWRERCDAERARAEKAEARAKELEAALERMCGKGPKP